MAGNFIKYAGHWDQLPIDAHEMVAMCAPRPVMITGGTQEKGDGWVDAKGMFLAAAGANPVYELLGKKGLGTSEMPPMETALIDGDLAFRQHNGGHTDALIGRRLLSLRAGISIRQRRLRRGDMPANAILHGLVLPWPNPTRGRHACG